jgi:formamidopyrimidine-DNA glycosylase
MPELPEVETVCRALAANLLGAHIARVEVRRRDLRVPVPARLEKALRGRTLKRVARRAKYIHFYFDDSQVLIAHLGMSGRLSLYKEAPAKYLRHDHVVIEWTDGRVLVFNDARRFGLMVLSREQELGRHPLFKSLGPEPLDDAWNGSSLYEVLKGSGAPVKSAIMDQTRLVGVGNIYACEALFAAEIHPLRKACDVTRKEAGALARAIRNVLEEAIASGGSTLRDYVRPEGLAGYFQHHFRVYGRQKQPCVVCGGPIRVIRQSGRSTFFCSHCQR